MCIRLPLPPHLFRPATITSWECGDEDGSFRMLLDMEEGPACEVKHNAMAGATGSGQASQRSTWMGLSRVM